MDKLAGTGVVYHGMELLGGGAVLAGLILGAVAAFIIDRRFDRAAIYAGAGAVLATWRRQRAHVPAPSRAR